LQYNIYIAKLFNNLIKEIVAGNLFGRYKGLSNEDLPVNSLYTDAKLNKLDQISI